MRKKRRKAVYVPYDYEAAYMNSLDKMEEANEERILKEGKVKSIYATKEIRSGDQLEVEIYPEFTKGQKDQIPDEGKRKRQRQAQKNLNDKNSKKMCERVIGENFTDRDIWATFTYTDDNMPASMEVATKNMQNYIRRLNYQRKKQGLSNARYVYVTECSEKRFDEAIAKFRIILDPEKTKRLIQKYIEKDRSDSHADVKNASRKVLEQITITMKAEEE